MTTQQVLDDRYGRRASRGRRRLRWIIVGVVIAAAVAVIAWITIGNPANQVHGEATAFTVPDDRTVTLTLQLTAPLGAKVACAVEALDEDFGVVGWRVLEFEASDAPTRSFDETIPTLARATTGLVNACWLL